MYVADQETQYLWTRVRVGDELREVKVPFGVGVPGYAVATGQPLKWEKTNKNTWRIVTGASRDWQATYRAVTTIMITLSTYKTSNI